MTSAKRPIAVTLGMLVTLFSVGLGYAQERPCTDLEGQHGLHETSTAHSWVALHRLFTLYRQCDDGAIAEGYSESVARILIDHWSTLPQLEKLAKQDPAFRAFVMGHVDATLDVGDIKRIQNNAEKRCPAELRAICDDIAKRAISALKEDASAQ